MNRKMEKKLRLFDLGAYAFAAAVSGKDHDPPMYACPVCLHKRWVYYRSAVGANLLTIEHGPPDCLGGRELVLICWECNNTAGQQLVPHMLKFEQLLRFGERSLDRPVSVKLSADGDPPVTGNLTATSQGVHFAAVPKANRAEDYQQLKKRFQDLHSETADSLSVNIVLQSGNERKVAIGWLWTAYCAAFAVFGYRFVLDRTLAPVREQLANLDSEVITTFMVTAADADPSNSQLMIVDEPVEYRSLLVQMGRHIVFLPWETSGNLYEFLDAERDRSPRSQVNYRGEIIRWPAYPQYVMDLAPPTYRSIT